MILKSFRVYHNYHKIYNLTESLNHISYTQSLLFNKIDKKKISITCFYNNLFFNANQTRT